MEKVREQLLDLHKAISPGQVVSWTPASESRGCVSSKLHCEGCARAEFYMCMPV
jgi:hypothetical protein